MTDFLVKHFAEGYDQVDEIQVWIQYGTLASIVGIGCNMLLLTAKLFVGVLVNSISVVADAFNSLPNAASSITGLIGVKTAERLADDDHPFGHGRVEYIAAFIVTLLVIQVGSSLFKTSIGRVFHPELVSFRWISIIILLLSIGIKLWLSLLSKRLGKRINSKAMLATATDAMGDVATTASTICSVGIYGAFGLNVDGIVGLIVPVVVMVAGVNIAKDTLAPLIGEGIDPEVYEEISNFMEGFDGIVRTHDLIVHNYGPSKSMASIHAEVPNDCDVEYSHEIIDRIEREAMRRFHMLLVIHMDPMGTHDKRVMEFKDMVAEVLGNIGSRLAFHGFRMVDRQKRINLIFDLVVPWKYKQAVQGKLKARISDEVKQRDRWCECVITVENNFVSGNRE